MRSGNGIRLASLGLVTLPAAVLLSGCVTTQDVAARARLVDARIRAGQVQLRIGKPSRDVRVTGLSLLRAGNGTAIVAELRDASARALTDLPVLVGVRTRAGRALYLNRAANTDYFDNHVAAIAPGRLVTWVFTSHRRLAAAGRPFAEVGASELPEPTVSAFPALEVTSAIPSAGPTFDVSVVNRSGIPQYGLPVYAVASRAGHVTAAGRATVAQLQAHGAKRVRLRLLGRVAGATVHLTVLPTIFH